MARIGGSQPFTALPNWIFDKQKSDPGWLSCQELSVLIVLQHFANGAGSDDDVFPSQKTISVCAGISKSTVIRSITGLVEKNLVEKIPRYDESGQKTNLYRLMIWDGLSSGMARQDGPSPLSERHPPLSQRQPPPVTETPPPCQRDTRTRTNEQEPMNKKKPPIAPQAVKGAPAAVNLPDWLEPHRRPLEQWLENRNKKHKLSPSLSKLTYQALEYAKSLGILQIYCEYASETNWRSLGFAGYKELIEKLARDHGIEKLPDRKPKMASITYTLK